MIDLTPIFQAVIALLAALVTYKLIPWIRSKTTQSQQEMMRAMVKTFVFAAEQIYGAGKGKEKLEYVKGALQEAGFDVNLDEIEAAVSQYLNNGFGPAYDLAVAEPCDSLPPLEEWPLEMIVNFFRDNGLPFDGEQTKEEYIAAIKQLWNVKEPEKEEAEPAVAEEPEQATVAEETEPAQEAAEEEAPGIEEAPPNEGQGAEE